MSDSETELPVLKINSKSSHPIRVEVKVNSKPLQMEVDTGAAVSIISEQTKNRLYPTVPLASPSVVLRTYTGEAMSVLGEMKVKVEYKDQSYNLTLMVVKGDGPNLFGRDWLQYFQLDWKTIGIATLDKDLSQVQLLKNKYKQVFAEGLGTMKKFKAHLRVKDDAKPVFHRPRAVPYAIKEIIEKELERLENEGIIEKVEHSEWAAPIVPVPKGDGQIRICGDYKVTINANLEVDQHPLPKPEDLFTSLLGGQKFSKLDLKHAYQQMMLDSDSRKYVTINTQKGLYRYTRLPFGIASAPGIFQRAMDSILQGLPQVLCYLDDILITGASKEDHMRNLETVLSRLQEYGIRVNTSKCVFLQSSVEYLGHTIDSEGLHTSPKKVKEIQEAPTPRNQQELRSFLGLLHYYGKFIPNLATMLHPLNELLKKGISWKWSKDCANAFKQAKKQENQMKHHDPHARARDLTVGQRVMVRNFRAGPLWIPGTVVKQNGPLTYLVKVKEDQVWKRHIDHVRQMEDTPRELLKSKEHSGDSDISETEFTDTSVTDVDGMDEISNARTRETTETATEPVATDVRRYPQRTRRPPERLIHQDSI